MVKIIAPLSIPPDPFADFLARLREILRDQGSIHLIGMPRNMDGSYGPAALKVQGSWPG
jgi:putative Holliday junction resolvase